MTVPHAFRYPGSKTKLLKQIIPTFPEYFRGHALFSHHTAEYREPFFGSGAVGLTVLYQLPPESNAWINDGDAGIANYWNAVYSDPKELIERISDCQPTVDLYREYRAMADDPTISVVESAFITIFLHQCSYSGLGKKAGSPIGGWDQTGDYKIDCRWHHKTLASNIQACHTKLRRLNLKITHGDFEPVFQDITDPDTTFFYCDPPYVKRGPELYAECMSLNDHYRLSALLHGLNSTWVLSYDDDKLIRDLYGDCQIQPIITKYTVTNGVGIDHGSSPLQELLITPLKPETPRKHGGAIIVTGRTGYHYKQLSDASGISRAAIRNRVRRGWSIEEATTIPQRLKKYQMPTTPMEIAADD